MKNSNINEFLVRTAWLYYVNGLTQAEIAKQLGENRLTINKALAQAKECGLVRIEIVSPFTAATELQDRLVDRFGLQRAFVGLSAWDKALHDVVGAATAFALKPWLADKSLTGLGVAWGSTLAKTVQWLQPIRRPKLEIRSLLGGLSKGEANNTFGIAASFAEVLGARYRLMVAPLFADNPEAAEALRSSQLIHDQIDQAARVDIALTSAGDLTRKAQTMREELMSRGIAGELAEAGAVGDVLGHFLDANGQRVDHPVNDQVIGISFKAMQDLPHLVLAAGGSHKINIIRAALAAGLVDTLVTDDETARTLLD